MTSETETLFSPVRLERVTLPNRLVRSATYEGCGDPDGRPTPQLAEIYGSLARGGVGTIITGFTYVSRTGRAMHPGQCGIDQDGKIEAWKRIVNRTREAAQGVRLFLQIAHAGRQTLSSATGAEVVGASDRRCSYFRQAVRAMTEAEIMRTLGEFGDASRRAMEAGFDGVQLHAAHGYLVHQFLSARTNHRKDRWSEPPRFLLEAVRAIRSRVGPRFPVLVKLSASEDGSGGLAVEDAARNAQLLAGLGVDAVEISYGTMERALNIIRGGLPVGDLLRVNPLVRRMPAPVRWLWKRFVLPREARAFLPFTENYNLAAALRVREGAGIPVIPVGGFRSLAGMAGAVRSGAAAVSLCRPLIAEPDLPGKILAGTWVRSACTNCNRCTINCDGAETLRCRGPGGGGQ